MSDNVEHFLAHYGVRGMKWGKRKGSIGSRYTSALSDRNQRQTAINNRALNGKSTREERVTHNLQKVLLGKKRFERMAREQNAYMADQTKRIAAGKLTMRDKLDAAMSTSATDLFVSRRDNKG